jgi:hypothetical protein
MGCRVDFWARRSTHAHQNIRTSELNIKELLETAEVLRSSCQGKNLQRTEEVRQAKLNRFCGLLDALKRIAESGPTPLETADPKTGIYLKIGRLCADFREELKYFGQSESLYCNRLEFFISDFQNLLKD